jgi:hypothetical protein
MQQDYLDNCGVEGSYYIDGDDCVLFLASKPKITPEEFFLTYGFKCKTQVVRAFEHIEFCQTRPVRNHLGWVMCRNHERVLTRLNFVVRRVGKPKRYLRSIALGEMACNVGIPVLQAFSKRLCDITDGARPYDEQEYHPGKMMPAYGRTQPVSITSESRWSFYEAYGVSPAEQLKIESSMDRVTIGGYDDHFTIGTHGI